MPLALELGVRQYRRYSNRSHGLLLWYVSVKIPVTTIVIDFNYLKNAFADRLGDQFDVFKILAVDFMHEVELGVWKSLFTHLIRLLYACDPTGRLVVVLNSRYVIVHILEHPSKLRNLEISTNS